MPDLNGSKTRDNLKAAFAGESQANRRYLYFAKNADVEGYPEVAGNFRETAEGWREMFTHNLDPVFFLGQAVMPGMRQRGFGRILTFSMANAHKLQANPQVAAHYAAKVGVVALTRTLARIGAGSGVTANCISPGFIDSGSAPARKNIMSTTWQPCDRIWPPPLIGS